MKRAGDLFSSVPDRIGYGLGLDLPWGEPVGFVRDPAHGDHVSLRVRRFLERYASRFASVFLAFQPRDRQILRSDNYFAAFDDFFDAASNIHTRALHHTMLNMGTLDPYRRDEIANFTNQLCARYGFKWIVEDLGIWSAQGKVVPYPMPPILTQAGLEASVANVKAWQKLLDVPLSVEFPGFTDGSNFYIGTINAFDFFLRLTEETDVAVTIDIGHILSYQWLLGRRGRELFTDLENLPYEHCFEFHLSGCVIANGKFRDAHHGVLLDEQIELLEVLLPRCPNLRVITYEDARFTDSGELIPKALPNVMRLEALVDQWLATRADHPKPGSTFT